MPGGVLLRGVRCCMLGGEAKVEFEALMRSHVHANPSFPCWIRVVAVEGQG